MRIQARACGGYVMFPQSIYPFDMKAKTGMSDADSGCGNGEDNRGENNHDVDEVAINRAFDLLAGQRRRNALAMLRGADDEVASVDDIADHLLAHDPDATDKDRVMAALYHQTLPKLDDTGVIDFDQRTDTVRYRGNELMEDLLDVLDD